MIDRRDCFGTVMWGDSETVPKVIARTTAVNASQTCAHSPPTKQAHGKNAGRRQLLPQPDAAAAYPLGGGVGSARALHVRIFWAAAAGNRGKAQRSVLTGAPSG